MLESRDLRILRVSPAYETEPQGRRNQRWFLNAVAEAETELFPLQLLRRIGKIEKELGARGWLRTPRELSILTFCSTGTRLSRRLRSQSLIPDCESAVSCWRRWPICRLSCATR
jgi:2-amino-4-hydroxy-6-hydroxymethyldihydropteridine diphosphokinase